MHDVENPLIPDDRDICGAIVRTARFEFICIKEKHAPVYVRGRGGYTLTNNPSREHHLMVNRWPYRPVPSIEESI